MSTELATKDIRVNSPLKALAAYYPHLYYNIQSNLII